MKKILMKALVLVLLLSVNTELFAQIPVLNKRDLKIAEINSIASLDNENNMIVESAIFNLLIFKDRYPEWNFNNITEKLNQLSVEGNSIVIRYKAQLTSIYLTNPSMFGSLKITEKENPAKYFRQIAEKVENTLVATN
ncbi:MAG: hypothetical protein KKB34_15425 [Bacteroidetes bacterium]|nr:hypothetical protein [Bacteroidota bacterium]